MDHPLLIGGAPCDRAILRIAELLQHSRPPAILVVWGLARRCQARPGFSVESWPWNCRITCSPRWCLAIDFVLSVLTISTFRLSCRLYRERQSSWSKVQASQRIMRVGILGAGHVGASLAREPSSRSGMGMRPVMFFDDDPRKWKTRVMIFPVVGSPQALMEPKLYGKLDKVIIAMPSAAPNAWVRWSRFSSASTSP